MVKRRGWELCIGVRGEMGERGDVNLLDPFFYEW
jgi:hypothetical protein